MNIPQPQQRLSKDMPLFSKLPNTLVDRFGRCHRSLRISVTDVCNIRCQYCMPEEVQFQSRDHQLSYQQIARFAAVTAQMGVSNYRITGGEPLVRPRLAELVTLLKNLDGIQEIALTTNGMLLAEQLPALVDAGLDRINISLDTLNDETFKQLSRRDGLSRVIKGIEAAVGAGGVEVKLNALVLRDVNLDDVLSLVRFATERNVVMRFIEFMPLDGERSWTRGRMVSGAELRELIAGEFGELTQNALSDPSQPSRDYTLANGGRVGFIDSVTTPFCGGCDRLRLTADGKIRNCLFGREEWDVAELLRRGAGETELQQALLAAVAAKHAAHGIADAGFQPPQRAMYQIGG
jgi:GTP 3',8-cyclase